MAANRTPSPRLNAALTPAEAHCLRRATPRTPAATARLSPFLSRDFGGPSPGGELYTPEQAEDLRAARDAERMAAALGEYARLMGLAVKFPAAGRGFRADARAALHAHPALVVLIGGER